MRRTSLVFGLVIGLLPAAAQAAAIVPAAFAAVEGSHNNGFPYNLSPFGQASQRYQQVYAAAEFPGLMLITGMTFRPDGSGGSAFSSTLADIQINLSTTAAAPDGLSTTFASNVGGDDTIVYARGALTLSSANLPVGPGPKNFDITILFTTPFLYNPTLGNLLMDVRNFAGGATGQFDAHAATGDSISRVFSNLTGVGATTGQADSLGLITRFDTQVVVPEPVTGLLIGAGLLAGAARRRRNSTR